MALPLWSAISIPCLIMVCTCFDAAFSLHQLGRSEDVREGNSLIGLASVTGFPIPPFVHSQLSTRASMRRQATVRYCDTAFALIVSKVRIR